jgi:hypothetical protein
MNLARHAAVLWRFRAVTAIGLCLGILLAIAASYRVSLDGGLKLVERGTYTYSSESRLLVTQPGFPDGRVVLPTAPDPESKTADLDVDPNRLEFADPNRFAYLTDVYTKLILSDEVRRHIPGRPSETQIDASPLAAVSGTPVLPIIELKVTADSAGGATALNANTAAALRRVIEDRQAENGIMPAQSIRIETLEAPSPAVLAAGPSRTASVLALLLCVIGTIALTHLLESLRPRHPADHPDAAGSAWPIFPEQGEARTNGERVERPVLEDAHRPR